jgi:hypothetical protein
MKDFFDTAKAFIAHLWKMITDPFLDKNGDFDEKRIFGAAFLIVGLMYAVGRFGTPDNSVLMTVLATGSGLIGLGIVGDVNNPRGPLGGA